MRIALAAPKTTDVLRIRPSSVLDGLTLDPLLSHGGVKAAYYSAAFILRSVAAERLVAREAERQAAAVTDFCRGAALGRNLLKAALREIYSRMPDLRVGEPDMLLSNFMNGVKSLPATWTPGL